MNISTREQQIVELVREGLMYREIAARLAMSPNTVKAHLRNIRTKLDIVRSSNSNVRLLKQYDAVRANAVNPLNVSEGRGERQSMEHTVMDLIRFARQCEPEDPVVIWDEHGQELPANSFLIRDGKFVVSVK